MSNPQPLDRKLREKLARLAPQISVMVTYEEDPGYEWDGDGPDPRSEGYEPYDVIVSAETISAGTSVHGASHLGGVYERPGQWDPTVGGYLPQMVDEALDDLLKNLRAAKVPTKTYAAQAKRIRDHLSKT